MAIINDILDLSKVEAGKLDLEQGDFALETILDGVRSLIAEPARAKGLTVETEAQHVPLWLRGDATRLRQALLKRWYRPRPGDHAPAGASDGGRCRHRQCARPG